MDERRGSEGKDPRRTGPVRVETCSADFEALRAASRRRLPTFAETARSFAETMRKREERGVVMKVLYGWRARPRLATFAVGTLVADAFLVVPISFDRTVGHEVSFTLAGFEAGSGTVTEIAKEMGGVLGAEKLEVRLAASADAGVSGAAPEHRLVARIAERSGKKAEAAASAYAAALATRGIAADFAVAPVRERVRSNVYLAAANSIINLRTAGRSAEEIASDLRSQLESAGVTGAEIDVTSDEDCAKVCVRVPGENCESLPEIQCEIGDAPDGRAVKIKMCRTPGMTDADVIADIERQLAEQGLSGTVTLDGTGCPKIELDE